ncbi:nucleic acid binding protein [[Candida] boidinii]|nr:nucleic acid binding protein [[Candida] boidinii]OWB84232.1 nucleic acid binding protein [[Candida] boidinii]
MNILGESYRNRSRSPPPRRRERDYGESRYERRGPPPRREYGSRYDRRGPPPRRYVDPREKERRIKEYEIKSTRIHENSIFVGNIPYDTTWYELKDFFKDFADVVRADIVTQNSKPRGMATVEFRDAETAQAAVSKFNRAPFKNREIFVREDLPPPEKTEFPERRGRETRDRPPRDSRDARDRPPRDSRDSRDSRGSREYDSRYSGRESYGEDRRRKYERPPRRDPPPPRPENIVEGSEIFVGNLPFRITWHDLQDMFKDVGEVVRAEVKEDFKGRSKGFGTVIFSSPDEAKAAIAKYHSTELDGRRIDVRAGLSYEKRHGITPSGNSPFTEGVVGGGAPSKILFVENLPWETTDEDLQELFGSLASVAKAELQLDFKGRVTGKAVVELGDEDSAAYAIGQLDNYNYGGKEISVSYAKYPEPVAEAPAPAAPVSASDEGVVDSSVVTAETEVQQEDQLPDAQPENEVTAENAEDDVDQIIEE